MIEFTVPGVPVAKGRPRFRILLSREDVLSVIDLACKGRLSDVYYSVRDYLRTKLQVQTYTPQETEDAERAFQLQTLRAKPRKPLAGPLHVTTVFVMPAPKSFPADRSHDWPHVKPDDDNLRKLVLDAMNGTFWHDDAQICGGESWKVYGEKPRTFVRVRALGVDDLERVRATLGEPSPQRSLLGGLMPAAVLYTPGGAQPIPGYASRTFREILASADEDEE